MKNIELEREQKIKIARIVASAVLTLAAVLALAAYFIPADGIAKLIIYAVPYLIVGYDVIIGAVKDLTKREIGEEFLMSAATIGAFCLAEYGEAVAVMLFYQIGELFGDIATDSSRRSIEALFDIRPDSATVIRGGKEITVSPEAVEAGEIIVVRPGERMPLDGEIIKGETTVDTSALTGESIPVSLTAGDKAVSGTVNLSGGSTITTSGTSGESTVAGRLRPAETSAEKKART
ncbi:MAG: heavy metal translocating P-type ATPase, partial [Firmicutes bacterium]|nr:heavy metal translocating P-type ATPase [Bacillota bacterium]